MSTGGPLSNPSQTRKPPGQSVAGVTQLVPEHVIPVGQAVGLPHCPHELQVCRLPAEHWVAPGVHTAPPEQVHAPHEHPLLHFCVPFGFVAQGCVVPGEQVPWPVHVPFCQLPLESHVWVSVPQLPQGTGLVCPGAHAPTHMPPSHVWPVHGMAAPHIPPTHCCALLPEHCVCPAVHAP
jgi:hypothetical protein